MIPTIDLSNITVESSRSTVELWDALCREVRGACEDYGCFEVVYDRIPRELRAETFLLIRKVFELPSEAKGLNINPKPYHSQFGFPAVFDHRIKTIGGITKQLEELWRMVEMLILDGYGLNTNNKMMDCKTLLRVMKYKAPPLGKPMSGLYGHTDKPLCTFLCEDRISGLEIQIKHQGNDGDGGGEDYVSVPISPSSFVFIVGDPLMAWSNGRMHAVKHRVTMSGDEDRYSMGAFQVPVVETIIRPPKDLVDDHRKMFKDFDYMDFINYSLSKEGTDLPSHRMIHAFAGI